MTAVQIRKRFLDFFEEHAHTVVPSSSLIPDDPSVLLTTAGMQQFKKYFTGGLDPQKDFGSKSTTSVQKSFRTSDIEEVGDESHLTFFEMLGNFSFGGYFKKEAIKLAYEFITKEMGLKIEYVSVFEGDKEVPRDEESEKIWESIDEEIVIKKFGRAENFWGPTGGEGPCGPTTEIYVKNATGNAIEIWNLVFNEYYSHPGGELAKLATPGVDTGMGLERLAMVAQQTGTIFETDLFTAPFSSILKDATGKIEKSARIVADHLRSSVFLLADGVRPSNKGAGYILRRLIRRLLVHSRKIGLASAQIGEMIEAVMKEYGGFYVELIGSATAITTEFNRESERFTRTLDKGLREFDKRYPALESKSASEAQKVGKDAFDLYQSYGFPIEVIKEILSERDYKFDQEEFEAKLEEEKLKHQEVSRAGAEAKFGGHGLYLKTGEVTVRDKSELEKVTRLHTATHLMHAGLRALLGDEVRQNGSDITVERTRFDFNFPRKVTPEELKKVEDWVNDAIKKDLKVEWKEMDYEEGVRTGALGFFREKYPPRVKVYTMFDEKSGESYSKEFCGGPHVEHTESIGKFKILKEESSSAGVRRVRAVIEP